jgi:hypothetical protein
MHPQLLRQQPLPAEQRVSCWHTDDARSAALIAVSSLLLSAAWLLVPRTFTLIRDQSKHSGIAGALLQLPPGAAAKMAAGWPLLLLLLLLSLIGMLCAQAGCSTAVCKPLLLLAAKM